MLNDDYFVTPDGMRIALSVSGPEDGDPVLFLHGGGQTRHAWGKTVEMLGARGWRAIAADLRGHGDSGRAAAYNREDFAKDVRALAKAQSSRPVIVGASLGGMAALLANDGVGDDRGEVSRALVLVDIAPRLNGDGVQRIMDFMSAHTEGFASLDEAGVAVSAYQPQRTQRADHSGLRKNLRLGDDGRWYWHWDPALLLHFRASRESEGHAELLYSAAEKLRQPVLLLRGAMSDVVDDSIMDEFSARIPGATIKVVGGAGHMIAGDKNDIFTEALIDFISELSELKSS